MSPGARSKISNLVLTELFYSRILMMNKGSTHTRSFMRMHFSVIRYRWMALRARKVSGSFEKRAPAGLLNSSFTVLLLMCFNIWLDNFGLKTIGVKLLWKAQSKNRLCRLREIFALEKMFSGFFWWKDKLLRWKYPLHTCVLSSSEHLVAFQILFSAKITVIIPACELQSNKEMTKLLGGLSPRRRKA